MWSRVIDKRKLSVRPMRRRAEPLEINTPARRHTRTRTRTQLSGYDRELGSSRAQLTKPAHVGHAESCSPLTTALSSNYTCTATVAWQSDTHPEGNLRSRLSAQVLHKSLTRPAKTSGPLNLDPVQQPAWRLHSGKIDAPSVHTPLSTQTPILAARCLHHTPTSDPKNSAIVNSAVSNFGIQHRPGDTAHSLFVATTATSLWRAK